MTIGMMFRRIVLRGRSRVANVLLAVIGLMIGCDASEPTAVHTPGDGDPEVARVVVEPDTVIFIALGETRTVSAQAEDSEGSTLTDVVFGFSSSDPSTVEVDDMGRLTARAVGLAMVSVTALCCGESDSVAVEVNEGPELPAGELIIFDDFESGGMRTDTNGFRWGGNNRTSVVRDDGCAVWNGGPIENCGASMWSDSWESRPGPGGRHALRFRYAAGQEWAEQRFDIGSAHRELWAAWWLRVPVNFEHRSVTHPNNKLFMFWMDDYSNKGDGSTVGMEMRPQGDGGSRWYVKISEGRNNVLGGDQGSVPFISSPDDRGRWMHIVVRMKAESSEDAEDGVMQVWRRWEDESAYTLTHDIQDQPIRVPVGGPQGFSAGYLMGYANSTYEEDTEFLMDDFTLATTSLVGGND